ncbi:MAG TPA: three-Cys-motif partner protein TcmP [Burkholderiales bacterium]|nr:three-Cys-motif partner protein TcmP [Burkholderiales bacterium]
MDKVDPDGLPASEVGAWAEEKHERLRKYVDAAHGARRRYSSRSYIDLYSGPGRSWIRETGAFIDGSPLVAFEAAATYGDQFTQILLADAKREYLEAAEKRLLTRNAAVKPFLGQAQDVVDEVIRALDPGGLHLAFLDPYNLGALPFSIIAKLASVKRMDLIIHVSAMDLKRDLHNYIKPDGPKDLDDFAPDWRKRVNTSQRQDVIRQEIFEYWRSLIKSLGTSPNDCIEVVENSKSSDLYWLVFVARHDLAHKLWQAIANVSRQNRLF